MRIALLVLLAACGNDRAPQLVVDAAPDGAPDGPTPPPGCDFGELSDPLNDITLGNGAAEATGLSLSSGKTICGRIDLGHFDAATSIVDYDSFTVTVPARTLFRIELGGAAAALQSVDVQLVDATAVVVDSGRFLGTHVAFQTTLNAGTYRVDVIAKNAADITAPIDYKLRTIPDPPQCARVTAAATFTEINDGAQNDGNDVVEVRYAPDMRALTAATTDAPETTGIITQTTPLRIAGISAAVDAPDAFKDRDTYLFATGNHDELAVRIDWTGDADFDFMVFPETTVAEIGRGTNIGKTAPEIATFPVLPNTSYWLWVGSFDSSVGLPINYDVTLCPTQFAN